VDLHHLLLAGLPAHFESHHPSQTVRLSTLLRALDRAAFLGAPATARPFAPVTWERA